MTFHEAQMFHWLLRYERPIFGGRCIATAIGALLVCGNTVAQEEKLGWDAEVDPTAYVLGGYSVHLGINVGHVRYDFGVYQADEPSWLTGNGSFDVSMRGVGVKVQYYPDTKHTGWFAGLSAGPSRETIEERVTGTRLSRTLSGVGIEAGYRLPFNDRFYATPWVGMDYMPQAHDIVFSNHVFADRQWMPFAAVHFGYHF
jgi:hypothetical protein